MFRVGALLCVAYAVTAVYIIPDVKHLQTHSPGGGRAQNSVTSKQPSIPKQPKLDRGLREVQSDPGTSQPAANANSSDAAPEKSTMSSPNPAQTAQAGKNGNETTVAAPAPPAAPAPAAASASAASTRAETPAVAAAAATTAAKKRVSTILSRASDGTKILTPTDGTKILIYASSSSDSSDISSDDSDSETNSSSSEPSNSSLPPGSETEPSSSSSYSSSSSSSSSPSSSDSEDEPSSSSSSTSSDGASSDSEAPSSDSGSESIGSTSPKSESESSDSEKDQEKNKKTSTPASTRASSPQPGAAAAPANTEPARDASTELSSKMLSASIVDKPTKLADAAKTTPQQVTNATGGDDALVVLTVGSITNSPLSDNRSTQSATTVQTESGHAGLQKETPKKATSLSTLKRAGRQTRELQQSSETATITDASRVPSTVTAVPPTSIPYLTTLTTAPPASTPDVDNNTNTIIITAITTKDPATTAVPSRASLTVTPLLSSSSSTISFSSFPSEPQTQLSVTQNATNKDNEWISSTESVSSPSAAFRTQVVTTTTTTTTNPTITTFPGDLCTRRYCPAKYGPFVLSAFTRVTFSRAECASDVAIFNDSLIIDPGLGASVFLTIYKRLSLTNRMIRLASELTEYTYTPADFI
ncbi:M116 protein [Murid betaherpesvirus 1]|uniref:M116 protein n=1 Tax=Murid herpesvirus 1 TaxID=10366 RepID=H2A100_MUHV1|nr:M116 protein [Murid betaherpesvirus 1]